MGAREALIALCDSQVDMGSWWEGTLLGGEVDRRRAAVEAGRWRRFRITHSKGPM